MCKYYWWVLWENNLNIENICYDTFLIILRGKNFYWYYRLFFVVEIVFYFESYLFVLNWLDDILIKVIYFLNLKKEDVSIFFEVYIFFFFIK